VINLIVIAAYPIALAYRKYVHGADKFRNNLALAASGCLIVIFNYGLDVYHSLIGIVATYVLTNFMQNSPLLMPLAFGFHTGYLLIGK
jgi:lysophospholipid acyltransferase 5